jgi:hypothetical protein
MISAGKNPVPKWPGFFDSGVIYQKKREGSEILSCRQLESPEKINYLIRNYYHVIIKPNNP